MIAVSGLASRVCRHRPPGGERARPQVRLGGDRRRCHESSIAAAAAAAPSKTRARRARADEGGVSVEPADSAVRRARRAVPRAARWWVRWCWSFVVPNVGSDLLENRIQDSAGAVRSEIADECRMLGLAARSVALESGVATPTEAVANAVERRLRRRTQPCSGRTASVLAAVGQLPAGAGPPGRRCPACSSAHGLRPGAGGVGAPSTGVAGAAIAPSRHSGGPRVRRQARAPRRCRQRRRPAARQRRGGVQPPGARRTRSRDGGARRARGSSTWATGWRGSSRPSPGAPVHRHRHRAELRPEQRHGACSSC